MRPDPSSSSVAVIIAAYNAADFIARAIRSALAEPEITQIIVVDDASADQTVAIARSCDDGSGRLTVLSQDKNAGPAAARNRALEVIDTQWVTVLDADDFFLPGRMRGLLAFAGDVDFIADDMWKVDEHHIDGPRRKLLPTDFPLPRPITFTDFVRSNVTQRGQQRAELGFIKPLMRREFLQRHQLHYAENMRLGEDFELYARALGLGARMILVPAQGYVSVVRETSLSGRHSEQDLLNLRNCDDALLHDLDLTRDERAALREHATSINCRYQWRLLINAVKARDLRAIAGCFMQPMKVQMYLCDQLLEQLYLRVFKKT